ncbi:MAG: DUF1499 domain-containing protein [Rhizobiaceae bacterium]
MAGYVERLSRVERHRSSAAQWCQRLAVFAVPYLLIVVLGHRFGAIDTVSTFWLLGLGVFMAVAALIAGVRGVYELWTYGHEAGLSAARGMLLATLLLLPFAYQAARAFVLPPIYDISTDLEDPPAYDTALDDRTGVMNPVLDPTSAIKNMQLQYYPRVTARRYPLGMGRVFREIVTLVGERNWTILTANTEQGKAPIDEEGSGLVAKPVTNSKGLPLRITIPKKRPIIIPILAGENPASTTVPAFETIQVSPTGRAETDDNNEREERYVEAVATSFLFGFESDVVIRLVEEEDGTLVDMRSTSRWGPHDLGSNAKRILTFMKELDAALQGLGQG